MPDADRITDEVLRSLDLTRFNDGENPYESNSVANTFQKGAAYYRRELERWGFTGRRRVLDLMCGQGRWSVFLAEANDELVGIDRNAGGIKIAQGLCEHLGLGNARFVAGDVAETRQFEDESFDAIWVWNALIYVERGPCLDEIHRMLRPGGRVLLGGVNSTGRLLEKLVFGLKGNTSRHKSQRWQAIHALRRGPHYEGRPNFVTLRTAARILDRHALRVTEQVNQGKRYMRLPVSIHVLAEKEGVGG